MKIKTLDEFILEKQKDFPYATGELSGLLRDIGVASKIINREVNKAGLVNILGVAGTGNASGDEVQKLDMYANDRLIECLAHSGECCGIASEENETFVPLASKEAKDAKYVVIFDPLDGSSNIDVNVSIGTIFAIYRRVSPVGETCTEEDFLQKGAEQVAAGYVLFGTSTILVYTTGNGVNGFTLDPSIGEFCLSHPSIQMPATSKFYSINQGYYNSFTDNMKRYVDDCVDKGLRMRFVGSMVADVHRTLFKGGVFVYPTMKNHPAGKLRLLYECNPLSMIVEQAGGISIDEHGTRILDLEANDLHQRTSIVMGSKEMLAHYEAVYNEQLTTN